eukprot:NODE_3223_length_2072_cov_11.732648.p1 GENE.NODE_3223_length_2072_cov_11.732648~~NODE_3223_length_2072_cov_11.732648.p1  ORF type:complete len:593 (-),score=201.62 NODE_3223_length_2072_cov_11.732648:171-1949(-)
MAETGASGGKTVGIIGAGISGIVASKELRELRIQCEVFEMMPMIGGVFAHYGWKEGKLTSSTAFTWFSDFPMKERQKHLAWPEWLQYLESYVDHFKTRDCFNFNCKVESTTKDPAGGWNLKIHRKNWSNGAWQHPTDVEVEEEHFEKHFDVLVAGSGLHNKPSIPDFQGAGEYQKAGGKIIHSADFQDGKDFAGQRVCVVGAGESGSDIAWIVSQQASQVAVSMRSPPGTLFPHQIKGCTADIRDNRLTYSLPRCFTRPLLVNHKRFFEIIGRSKEESHRGDQFRWAANSNYENGQCIFTINACKSFGIPKAVTIKKATVHKAIKMIEDDKTVHFEDGSSFQNCDAIIACTGYKLEIPAMGEDMKDAFKQPRGLWNNMVNPEIEDFFLMGFCRPHQINLITCCEMQARALSLVVAGKRQLPAKEEMYAEIEAFRAHMARHFGRGGPALVDFIPFVDGIAEFIGCAPDLAYWMFKDPVMFCHMIYGSIQPCQYRLAGPGASFEKSREVILETPYYKDPFDRLKRHVNLSIICLWFGFLGLLGNKKWALVGKMRPPFQIVAGALAAVFVSCLVMVWMSLQAFRGSDAALTQGYL